MAKKKRQASTEADHQQATSALSDDNTPKSESKAVLKAEKKAQRAKEQADKKVAKKKKKGFWRRVGSYFKELKNELKKVVWPTKSRIVRNTVIVLSTVIVVAVIVCLLDLGFQNLLKLLLGQFS